MPSWPIEMPSLTRDRAELQRVAAGRVHAVLDRLGQPVEREVAGGDLVPGARDADLRLGEVVVAEPDRAQHAARGGLLEAVGDVAAARLDVGLAGGCGGRLRHAPESRTRSTSVGRRSRLRGHAAPGRRGSAGPRHRHQLEPGAAGVEVAPAAGEPQHRERGRREAVGQRLARDRRRELLDQQRARPGRGRPGAGSRTSSRGAAGRRPAACRARRRTPRRGASTSRRTPRPGARPPRSAACAPTVEQTTRSTGGACCWSHSPAATASRWPRAVSSRSRSAFPVHVLGLGVAQQDEGPV